MFAGKIASARRRCSQLWRLASPKWLREGKHATKALAITRKSG